MDTRATGSSKDLSAPESYILLHGPKGGPEGAEETLKLALMELAARGWITTDEKSGGVEGETSEAQVDSLLARGETDFAPKQRPLVAALAVFEGALSEAGNPQEGIPAAEVRRFAEDRYGKLSAFAEEEVLPSLQERGYYEYSEDKMLGLIPREGYKETEAGGRARQELELTTEQAQANFPDWARRDPDRALSFLGTAGPAMLLMPSLYPQAAGITGSEGAGADAEEMAGFGEGSLEPSAFEGLAGLSGGLDAAFSEDLTSGLFASSFLDGMFGNPGGAGYGGGGFGGDGGGGGGP